jgi:hypothetical protein
MAGYIKYIPTLITGKKHAFTFSLLLELGSGEKIIGMENGIISCPLQTLRKKR